MYGGTMQESTREKQRKTREESMQEQLQGNREEYTQRKVATNQARGVKKAARN